MSRLSWARPTVVVLASPSQVGDRFVDRVSPLADVRFAANEAELRRQLPGADVLLGWDYDELGALARAWDAADRLAWIQMIGIGVDGILSPALIESDTVITITRGVSERPIAEYVAAVLLFWMKDVRKLLELQAEHRWQRLEMATLAGRKATVLGAGGVGRAIARLLLALEMDVTVVARGHRQDPELGEVVPADRLDELLPSSEFLVLALPLTAASRGLVDERRLGLLPRGARLVNVGRGSFVEEAALHDALSAGHLAAAALDVFEAEPLPPDHPLWDAPNLLVTSHTVGDALGWRDIVTDHFVANLQRYRQGEELDETIDKSGLDRSLNREGA